MKHKNYEWIVAWAEGKEVQFKANGVDGSWGEWENVGEDLQLLAHTRFVFRIKPEKKKSHGYRRYLDTRGYVYACVVEEECEAIEHANFFKQWIDTEPQYYEYEEEA